MPSGSDLSRTKSGCSLVVCEVFLPGELVTSQPSSLSLFLSLPPSLSPSLCLSVCLSLSRSSKRRKQHRHVVCIQNAKITGSGRSNAQPSRLPAAQYAAAGGQATEVFGAGHLSEALASKLLGVVKRFARELLTEQKHKTHVTAAGLTMVCLRHEHIVQST